jgi:hypothetical protein
MAQPSLIVIIGMKKSPQRYFIDSAADPTQSGPMLKSSADFEKHSSIKQQRAATRRRMKNRAAWRYFRYPVLCSR